MREKNLEARRKGGKYHQPHLTIPLPPSIHTPSFFSIFISTHYNSYSHIRSCMIISSIIECAHLICFNYPLYSPSEAKELIISISPHYSIYNSYGMSFNYYKISSFRKILYKCLNGIALSFIF